MKEVDMYKPVIAGAAALGALAIGSVSAYAGPYDPASPSLSATLGGIQPSCAYSALAAITNITPGDEAILGVILWKDGKLVMYSGDPGNPKPLTVYPASKAQANPASLWSKAGTTPENGTYDLALYVQQGSAWEGNGEVILNLPNGYSGTCAVPIPTLAPTLAPTVAPPVQPASIPQSPTTSKVLKGATTSARTPTSAAPATAATITATATSPVRPQTANIAATRTGERKVSPQTMPLWIVIVLVLIGLMGMALNAWVWRPRR